MKLLIVGLSVLFASASAHAASQILCISAVSISGGEPTPGEIILNVANLPNCFDSKVEQPIDGLDLRTRVTYFAACGGVAERYTAAFLSPNGAIVQAESTDAPYNLNLTFSAPTDGGFVTTVNLKCGLN